MEYTVLSPWAEQNASNRVGLSPRVSDLNGKTIGMNGHFMNYSMFILEEIEKAIAKRYPGAKFSYIQYKHGDQRIERDDEFESVYREWVSKVDCIVQAYAATPSCGMTNGYNAAYAEQMGKPTVMVACDKALSTGRRGSISGGVPALRIVHYDLNYKIRKPFYTKPEIAGFMEEDVDDLAEKVIAALTDPLTEEEKNPPMPSVTEANRTFTGTAEEISNLFYKKGWTVGLPINMPTAESVEEMLTGTDLPRDHVVGLVPPMMGRATVEKIAINAVMAGCLPTYMPVLIAAVEAALDKSIYLEGWCTSASTWGPAIVVSGNVVKDIDINAGRGALSPYYKANNAIAKAFGYIITNIGGIRPKLEDVSEMGHEFRLGFCVGEDEEHNPWPPLHVDYGFKAEDSAVTLFWPQEHHACIAETAEQVMNRICGVRSSDVGWEPGALILLTPHEVDNLVKAGIDRKTVKKYMVEYARRPSTDWNFGWLRENNHLPDVCIPLNKDYTARAYWSEKTLVPIVCGEEMGRMLHFFTGGGEHGGPLCTKVNLPKNWKALVEKYSDMKRGITEY